MAGRPLDPQTSAQVKRRCTGPVCYMRGLWVTVPAGTACLGCGHRLTSAGEDLDSMLGSVFGRRPVTLPELILSRRKALGLNQQDLAARLGVRQQAVSRWESGAATPRVDRVPSLLSVLDVSKTELYRAAGLIRVDECVAPCGPEGGK